MFNELHPIRTLSDVIAFARYLYFDLSTAFHPDDDFSGYVDILTATPSFTSSRAATLNARMEECHAVCASFGVDIYDIMDVRSKYFETIAAGCDTE